VPNAGSVERGVGVDFPLLLTEPVIAAYRKRYALEDRVGYMDAVEGLSKDELADWQIAEILNVSEARVRGLRRERQYERAIALVRPKTRRKAG
jgi:hypothetical protein